MKKIKYIHIFGNILNRLSDSTKHIQAEPTSEISRRGFMKSVLGIWTGVLSLPFIYAIINFIIPPQKKFLSHEIRSSSEPIDPRFRGDGTKKIPLDKLPENTSVFINIEGEPVLVIRKGELEISAFLAICTHLNCIVGYRKNQRDIYCNCHGSSFNLDGIPLNGPARLPLKKHKISVENNIILVEL